MQSLYRRLEWRIGIFLARWDGPLFALAVAATVAFFLFLAMVAEASAQPRPDDLLDRVNTEVNRLTPCTSRNPNSCHRQFPDRADLLAARYGLTCSGYVMAKAFALMAVGISHHRMRVAIIGIPGPSLHAILVVDGIYALDNLTLGVMPFHEYSRFDPILTVVPHT